MSARRHGSAGAALVLAAALAGCQWVPKSRLAACESQHRDISAQVKAQLAEIENVKAYSRSVENQLARAEEELAVVDERAGLDRRRLANFQRERQDLHRQFDRLARGPGGVPPALAGRLADLSQRYPSLEFDRQTGVSKFDTEVLFDSGDARLKPEGRRMLDEFAALWKAPEARDLRIMVAGHTDNRRVARRETRERYPDNWHLSAARALAVADHLQRAGVREEQLAVAGFGRHQPVSPNSTAADREKNRRVEIFVIGPETPVVGWADSTSGLY